MRQQSLATAGFEKYCKKTRKEKFLADMDQIIPWRDLCKVIKPFYSKAKGAGQPPVGLERMLRIHFLQHWFILSDPAAEEALYDSRCMRDFVGLDLGRKPAPGERTILNFRYLLEARNLGNRLFVLMNDYLQENGFKISTGTIVDATLIAAAPSSTKNKEKKRDPEMHRTRKGNQWYFGMKAHIGVDSQTKMIHTVAATAANVHDSQLLSDLLHGEETRLWGDSAYTGQRKILREKAPKATDFTHRKGNRNHPLTDEDRARNKTKSKVRAKFEHPFLILKKIFGFRKARYRGIDKNANRLFVACGLVNPYMVQRQLLRLT